MSVEKIDTLVVGAGQAGIALCEHLGQQGVPFLVLEKSRIAEAWRTSRWDALVTNGPMIGSQTLNSLEMRRTHLSARTA
jgi:putative flavoprotein involved in K+ transport